MITNIVHGTDARRKLAKGVEALVKAVRVTLGPKGRNVAIEKNYGGPLVTKDGVSVAKEVDLEDPFEQMGVMLAKGAASKTSEDAGDGTTTSTVLTGFLYSEGLKLVEAGVPPVQMKRGMDKAVAYLSEGLLSLSIPVEDKQAIAHVGTVSANGDEKIGNILADAIEKVGRDGVIQIEDGKGMDLELEVQDGMMWDRGPHVREFLLKNGVETILEDVIVFVTDIPFTEPRFMQELLQELAEEGKPVLFVAPDFGQEATACLFMNLQKGNLVSIPVKAPGFGDRQQQYLGDIAILTGATFVTKEQSWKHEDVRREHLGFAKKVVVTQTTTTLIDGGGEREDVQRRIAQIRGEIARCSSEFDREKLQERLSKLLGGICTIKVGAPTELAVKELKARIEDALHATRASIDEGIVAGGGSALLQVGATIQYLQEENRPIPELPFPEGDVEQQGWNLVLRSCEAPIRAILENAGFRPDVLIEKVLDSDDPVVGVDARTGEVKNLIEAGVVDPVKVVRMALINAVSVTSTMLTTECLIRKPETHTVLNLSLPDR